MDDARLEKLLLAKTRSRTRKNNDRFRRPRDLFQAIGLRKGETVLDLSTGTCYWAELFSAATGGEAVYAHNADEWHGFFKHYGLIKELDPYTKPTDVYDVRVYWAPMGQPDIGLPDGLAFDVIFSCTNYHDLYDMPVDRARLWRILAALLKPETGRIVVVDHKAPDGSGAKYAGSNRGKHRVDETLVTKEAESSGLCLHKQLDLYRLPGDDLTSQAWTSPFHDTWRFAHVYRPVASSQQANESDKQRSRRSSRSPPSRS